MGVLPLQFQEGEGWETFDIKGDEVFSLKELGELKPRQEVILEIHRGHGKPTEVKLISCLNTPIDIEYYTHGGILPYVLRQIL
jgi:aconitate hydratase